MNLDYLVSQYQNGRQLLFDLDNTIFEEKIFLFRAYRYITINIANPRSQEGMFEFLKSTFSQNGRGELFNKLVAAYNQQNFTVERCLQLLRSYKCDKCIEPYPWFKNFLNRIDAKFELYIITNGNVMQQKNKIASINFPLNIKNIKVVFANQFTPKPSIDSYTHLKKYQNMTNPLYVGDSATDKIFSERAGIEFLDVHKLM